ncbi:hypothetical protein IVB03_39440 [Bradyrhizobium sp. 168]|uniref:hypothetical protein n=1 Tax=Bradyrhizobium sp. 168 TaxID=2782639 RepID=UPI001FFA46E5|nr:hypothetical protein [Bradyrhizobium sp. 168]MCK1585470.1 hypothetical protein [Bradyrhizobium sp. 168]
MPTITDAISGLTERVIAYRIIREMGLMPLIEIKGLGTAVASAKKGIADVRTAAAELNTEAGQLVAEIGDLTSQVKQHRADLRFEAETLGNSSPPPEPRDLQQTPQPPSMAISR